MFSLDRDSSVPLADQIEHRLRAFIEGGQLSSGARLPSIRTLAAQLGVSPNTVVTAYDRLVAAACIDSRGTAGFFVSEAASQPGQMPGASLIEPGDEQEPVWLVQQQARTFEGGLKQSCQETLYSTQNGSEHFLLPPS